MKRKLRNRLTAILAVTLCMTFMLTACGNTSTDNTTADNSNTAPEVQETAETSDTITFSEFLGSLTEPLVMYGFNHSSISSIIVIEPESGKVYELSHFDLPNHIPYGYFYEKCPFTSKEGLANEIDNETVISLVKSGLEGKPLPISTELEGVAEEDIVYDPDCMYHFTNSYVMKNISDNELMCWGCAIDTGNLDEKATLEKIVGERCSLLSLDKPTTHETFGDISYTKMDGYYFKDTDLTMNKTIVPDTEDTEPFVFSETAPDASMFETYYDSGTSDSHGKVYRTEEALEREKAKMAEKEAAEAEQPEPETEQETEVDWEDVW